MSKQPNHLVLEFQSPVPLFQLLQTVDDFAADMRATGYLSYRDLVNRHYIPLR